jgi:hypothetical protein
LIPSPRRAEEVSKLFTEVPRGRDILRSWSVQATDTEDAICRQAADSIPE